MRLPTLRTWHRRMGLLVGVPCLLWGLSGITLALKNYLRPQGPGAPQAVAGPRTPFTVSVAQAIEAAGHRDPPEQIARVWLLGHPRYELRFASPPRLLVIDGLRPAVLPPITEALALRVAAADAPGRSALRCTLQTEPSLYYRPGRELPVLRVGLDNGDDVYLSPQTGEVLLHMDTLGRLFRVAFFALHVWDLSVRQDPGGHASYLLLMLEALLLLCVGASGLWMALRRPR